MKLLLHIIHWFGFLLTCFMIILSALDKSRDEIFIHITAFASVIGGARKFFPFLKSK